MKIIRNICIFALIFTMLFSSINVFASNITVNVDGESVVFTGQQPVIVNGSTLVPVRGVFEQLGFEVSWNGDTRQVTLESDSHTVVLTIGSSNFTVNGATHTIEVPAQIINGSTMLPLRAVIEGVGMSLDWEGDTRTISIGFDREFDYFADLINQSEEPTQQNSTVAVGDIIQFGAYSWQVLDVQDDRALIITKNVVMNAPYSNIPKKTIEFDWGTHLGTRDITADVTWETSYIRAYLNNEFFNSFNVANRSRILETLVINNDNQWNFFGRNERLDGLAGEGGNDTIDKIFLLSIEEVVSYFGDSGFLNIGINADFDVRFLTDDFEEDGVVFKGTPVTDIYWYLTPEERLAFPYGAYIMLLHDQYNNMRVALDIDTREASEWWLRSPGGTSDRAAFVLSNGMIRMMGELVDGEILHGVRPAMWIRLIP